MHDSVRAFVSRAVASTDVVGKTVLEVGALDVNGSIRSQVECYGPKQYCGTDMRNGPGVDVVCSAAELVECFGLESFDLILCLETLEHVENVRNALVQMHAVLRPGGRLILTTRSVGFPLHDHPGDFWRFSLDDMRQAFGSWRIDTLEADIEAPGVFLSAVKLRDSTIDGETIGAAVSANRGEAEAGPRIGVVIPTLGTERDLRPVLAAWKSQGDRNFALEIVVDFEGCVTKALNQGWKRLKFKVDAITFQADDILPSPDFVYNLRTAFSRLVYEQTSEDNEPWRPVDVVEFEMVGGARRNPHWGWTMTTWAASCEKLRAVSLARGPWDEQFDGVGWRADLDLGWRLEHTGAVRLRWPSAIVYHPEHAHSQLDVRNERRFQRKWQKAYAKRIEILSGSKTWRERIAERGHARDEQTAER